MIKLMTIELRNYCRVKVFIYPSIRKVTVLARGLKRFTEKSGLSSAASKILRTALKPLSDKLNVIVKGEGLILTRKL